MTERTPEQIAADKEKMAHARAAAVAKRNLYRLSEEDRVRQLEEEKRIRDEEARWAGSANLGGLTARNCPHDCKPERCVISGINVCAHPSYGGPQAALRGNPEVMERFQKAERLLAHQKVEAG